MLTGWLNTELLMRRQRQSKHLGFFFNIFLRFINGGDSGEDEVKDISRTRKKRPQERKGLWNLV